MMRLTPHVLLSLAGGDAIASLSEEALELIIVVGCAPIVSLRHCGILSAFE